MSTRQMLESLELIAQLEYIADVRFGSYLSLDKIGRDEWRAGIGIGIDMNSRKSGIHKNPNDAIRAVLRMVGEEPVA